MPATTLTVVAGEPGWLLLLSRWKRCWQRLTGRLRNHRLELLRGLHLLQLSQKLIGGGKTEHISLLLGRGS